MIAFCTGQPRVVRDGDRILATIPSGRDEIVIALNFGQASRLSETMIRTANLAIYESNVAAAPVLPLRPTPKGRRKRAAVGGAAS
jgi:hypothetical protein